MLWGGMPNWVMWMAPEGHGNNLAWVAAKNYDWGHGLDRVRICVEVPGPCCCQSSRWYPPSESHIMAMLVSEGCHHCQCQRDLGAQCCQLGSWYHPDHGCSLESCLDLWPCWIQSLLTSVVRESIRDLCNAGFLGCYPWPCWYLRAKLLWEPCRSGWSILPPGTMVKFGPWLLPRTITGSVVLP